MAAILDHIHIGCANVYTTAFDLTKATKLGHYDGGFTGNITIDEHRDASKAAVILQVKDGKYKYLETVAP